MSNKKFCDLHCHSTFSDGSCTPQELVDLAVASGLGAIALTDHNTIDGHQGFIDAAKDRMEVCAGCEFTTEADGQELHLLGMFLDSVKSDHIKCELAAQQERKETSNRLTIDKLAEAGYPLSYQEFVEIYGDGSKNRVHIASYLKLKGIVSTIQDAFRNLLANDSKFLYKSPKMAFYDIIRLINDAGGVTVWAHPLVDVDRHTCRVILDRAVALGLDGVEVRHSKFSVDDILFMESLCKEYNLLPSGGSDFHGSNKPEVSLGIGKGNLRVPYEWYQQLRTRAEEKRAMIKQITAIPSHGL